MLSSLSLHACDKCKQHVWLWMFWKNFDVDVPLDCNSLCVAKLVNDAYFLSSILVLDYHQHFIEMHLDKSCF